ncbi:AI-2E family transporter [Jatrophihabitans lederbergiae]|jgi:predicted PurR-regulated permease PerM|uniref:AI-2E family transporter n=1 Tax=Jatrophihabitans lederbergiae TaxID=3075547 RepID=A0ABU2JA97_9ACTN|nr:AI-2E family transporter [Jatrophihabitans sp. DSM 44399]MDT0261651.1 AI-2E family transporter [Jatrophihabitans sp. DSM 44399]
MDDGERGLSRLPPVRYYVKVTVAVLLTLLAAYGVYRARSILVLIFLGLFLAVGLEPVIQRLERRGIRRGFCVLAFGLLIGALLVGLVFLVLAPATGEVTDFVSSVPDLLTRLNERLAGTSVGDYLNQGNVQQRIQSGLSSVLERSASGIFGIVGGLISAVFTAVTLFILTVYFMLAMPRLRDGLDRILATDERRAVLDESLSKVGGYVTGQLAICACAGVASYIALELIGVPYPALLAIVITVLDAVPQVGATIGAVLAVLVALTASIPAALIALVYFVLYQQLENYLIAPRVFSRTIALTPLASLLAVLVGAALAGVVGAIVALPMTAAGSTIFRNTSAGRSLLRDDARTP